VGCGTVFELSPRPRGVWTETVLYNFGNGNDGINPNGSLIMDAAGNLYGTTNFGGIHDGGTVFELSSKQGGWRETVLYGFKSDGNGGEIPMSGLISPTAWSVRFGIKS
jgi:uncharacterized repeat protein (TIGR03803 family)